MTTVGERIRHERTTLGLSARALSRRCGVDASMIIRAETGTNDLTTETARRILRSLGCDLDITRPIPLLADASAVAGDQWNDWTRIRLVTDHAHHHPGDTARVIDHPPETRDPRARNLLAAVAETLADETGIPRPAWCVTIPPLDEPWEADGTPRMIEHNRTTAPQQFTARNIHIGRESIWRAR